LEFTHLLKMNTKVLQYLVNTFHFWENSQNHNLMNKVCQYVICNLHLLRNFLSELIRLFIEQL
jgi:hypothetical protein